MTISNLIKMEESSSKRKKTLAEKEKLLVMSNISFLHCVFKRLVLQIRKNQGLFGKGFRRQLWSPRNLVAILKTDWVKNMEYGRICDMHWLEKHGTYLLIKWVFYATAFNKTTLKNIRYLYLQYVEKGM